MNKVAGLLNCQHINMLVFANEVNVEIIHLKTH